MNKKILTFLLFTLLLSLVSAQTGSIKIAKPTAKDSTKKNFISIYPSFGYKWEGYNCGEFGATLKHRFNDPLKSINYSAGIDVFNHNVTYVSPYASIGYVGVFQKQELGSKDFKKGRMMGWNINLVYTRNKVNEQIDQLVTPEIGIRLWGLTFSYGYNIPLDKFEINFISKHRFIVRLTHP